MSAPEILPTSAGAPADPPATAGTARGGPPTAGGTAKEPPVGVGGAFSIGIGGIVGGGIFATIGLAASEAGGAAWLSFLVGGALALVTAYSYARLSLAFPSKGGTVRFLDRAFGTGVLAGGTSTMLVLSYVVILALYASAFASYAVTLLPEDARAAAVPPLEIGVIVILAGVNLVGPGLVSKTEGVFNVGKLAILGLFVVAGFVGGGIVWERLGPETWKGPMPIIAAGMLVFLSYEGFELIANASDRIADPRRTLPIAFFGSVTAAMVLYLLIVVVTLGYLPLPAIVTSQSSVLATAADAVMGPIGGTLLAVGALLATASAINADYFGASKLPVMLAEEDEAPEVAGREAWGRHPVGLLAIMVLAVICAAFLDLHALSAAASAGFLAVFFFVNVANARVATATRSIRIIPIVGALATLFALIVLLADLAGGKDPVVELCAIAALFVLPYVYQWGYRRASGAGDASA